MEIDQDSPSSNEASKARRRQLIRLAASGAPLLVTLRVGAAVAQGSAYRAAAADADATGFAPRLQPAGTSDSWIRVQVEIYDYQACKARDPSDDSICTGSPDPAAYEQTIQLIKHNGTYYKFDGSSVTVYGADQIAPATPATQWLLILFASNALDNSNPQLVFAWPDQTITSGLQALHCSSWRSIHPGTAVGGNCNGVA